MRLRTHAVTEILLSNVVPRPTDFVCTYIVNLRKRSSDVQGVKLFVVSFPIKFEASILAAPLYNQTTEENTLMETLQYKSKTL